MTGQMGDRPPDLAIFAATSGHSGVDRIIANLLPELDRAGIRVDLLRIRDHGPYPEQIPLGTRIVNLGSRHVATSLPALVRYLRAVRPPVILSDKDRVNRTVLRARALARSGTRCAVRLGTTVSVNLVAKARLEAWLQRRSMKRYGRADMIIVPSEGAADDLAAVSGIERQRIHVLPNPVVGADLAARTADPPPHPWLADTESPVIMGVGSLSARKDYATLMRAFARVRERRRCRLIVLGRGPEKERLLALAADLGVGADVTLPGFADNPYAWMARARVFAHSSRWEGLGIVLVEALALGLPIVATDCPSGPSEVLDRGRFGRLVPVGDPAAMSAALEDALDAPDDPATLRRAARRFRIDVTASAYIDALGLVPAARPAARTP